MAYYDSVFGENNYHQIPFYYSYDHIVLSDLVSGLSTTYDEAVARDPKYFHCDPMNYYYSPCPESDQTSFASVAYSAFALSEPKHVVYDPNCYYNIYESPPDAISETRISYSVSEFNETDFEEYDPTPYGGGYNITATYGKPLPPSEKTCYPLSSVDPATSPALDNVPVGSVEPSTEKEKVQDHGSVSEPSKETKPTVAIEEKKQQKEEEEEEDEEDEEEDEEDDDHHQLGSGSDKMENGAAKQVRVEDHDGDGPRSGHGSDKVANGETEQIRARYIPSGYGLEAMDLCETIFGGYFPCLLRNKRRDDRVFPEVSCYERNDFDPWKGTSDYLFGNLNPYSDENYDGRSYTESLYGYQRHYQEQPMYQIQKVDYEGELSWWHR